MHAKSMAQDVKIDEYKKLVGNNYSDENYNFFKEHYNNLANMQLLSKKYNIDKLDSSLKDWFTSMDKQDQKSVKEKYLIPYKTLDDLELYNFETFYKNRANLMCEKLCKIFNVPVFKMY